tara:strand:+ start:1243 stop:1608 length:366 start_codon:yes stop_codon:yes gene_type:complete
MADTNVNEFTSELGAGVFQAQLAHLLSEVALGTVNHGSRQKRGKITIELSFQQLAENQQLIVTHKLSNSTPTNRGKRSEETSSETAFFMGKGGVLTISPPKEDDLGQFQLKKERDGVISIK